MKDDNIRKQNGILRLQKKTVGPMSHDFNELYLRKKNVGNTMLIRKKKLLHQMCRLDKNREKNSYLFPPLFLSLRMYLYVRVDVLNKI